MAVRMSAPTVLLAMSGGVDSSVAAVLLLRLGYSVVGAFMRLGSPGEELEGLVEGDAACRVASPDAKASLRIGHRGCCSINDAADARLVAAKLGIPFYVCNFKRDFGRIVSYFEREYHAGRTPNPCVRCNDWLKFGKLHEYAESIGASFVASGHYARIGCDEQGRATLERGIDRAKDQSYVLFGARRERLERMLLPIGGLRKSEVRRIAAEEGLPVFDKPDSQEICFVPDDDYAGLIARRSPGAIAPGPIVDATGRVVGEHPGHQHFTVGQRRGLGVAAARPLYVIEKDAATNTIVVGERALLERDGCIAAESNWLVEPPAEWRRCTAMIRSHAEPVAARARALAGDRLEVRFDAPQTAVAPGQAVVLYEGERVLGGGWIERATRSREEGCE
jgi:tRNA-specific 2-thiouridylase